MERWFGVRFFVGERVKNIWFWGGWVILIETLALDGVRLKESGNLMADFYCVLCMMYKRNGFGAEKYRLSSKRSCCSLIACFFRLC